MALNYPHQAFRLTSGDSSERKLEFFKRILEHIKQNEEQATSSDNLLSIVDYLVEKLLLPENISFRLYQMVYRLQQFFCTRDIDCELKIFGSVGSGLALKDQYDVDVYLESLSNQFSYNNKSIPQLNKYLRDLQKLVEANENRLFPLGCRIELITHPKIRVPLLRIFNDTNFGRVDEDDDDGDVEVVSIRCDLNINSPFGVENTKFIKFLCDFEPKFKAMAILVKLWARDFLPQSLEIKLSSYAALLLVTFFLQNRKILPPIRKFIQASPHRAYIDGYRVDFCTDISRINFKKTQEQTPIHKLFAGFFDYYTRLDYRWNRLSVFEGRLEAKKHPVFNLVLFDPFEHTHNTTSQVKLREFVERMKKTQQLFGFV
ncbi:hypothetical protein NH340_JMT07450 [Sarcoptes scabiei]|nr:hypothetical protein NH340_JMT07450 [Sarcoptes scabiei]